MAAFIAGGEQFCVCELVLRNVWAQRQRMRSIKNLSPAGEGRDSREAG
jgi:hypothetical protein